MCIMFSKKKNFRMSKKDLDSQFESFLKESISSEDSSLDTARVAKYLQNNKKKEPAWWMNGDDDSVSESALGLTGTGKSFLKKKAPVSVKQNASKANEQIQSKSTEGFEVNMSRDSLDEMSLRGRDSVDPKRNGVPFVPGLALDTSKSLSETATADNTHPGLETLQEIAEKEKFFKDFEKNSGDSTIDYSRLNRDLDHSATLHATLSSEMAKNESPLYNGPVLDESEDEEDEDSNEDDYQSTGKKSPEYEEEEEKKGPHEKQKDSKSSMLSKVALMDSFDSTMGTKQGSQEPRQEDMRPIPEDQEQDELDGGYRPMTDSRAMTTSEPTTKGLVKTGTGFTGFTDTSQEIEALQAAYRQVGMSATMASTHDFTLQDSSSVFNGTGALPIRESHVTTGTADAVTENTPAFGLKPMAHSHHTGVSERTVEDIIQEVDELKKTGEKEIMPAVRFKDEEEDDEPHGFDLSPVHTQDNMHGMDLSPVHSTSQFENNAVLNGDKPFELYESSNSPLPVPAPRTPRKQDKKQQREKFPHVRSSGYGKISPAKKIQNSSSPNNKSVSKSNWTPADTLKNKVKGTENLKKKGNNVVSFENSDNQLVASVQSFANYIKSHFSETQISTDPTGKEYPTELQDTSEAKIPVLEREKALMKEVKEWQDQWREERKIAIKLKADMENMERELKRKLESQRIEFEEELFKLKQENFVLSAKAGEKEASSEALVDEARKDAMSKGQLGRLEKEIKEQEGLLAGYQTENERLYQELKKMQNLSKTTEEQMFKENQRLNQEVSNLRHELEQKELALKNKGLITGAEIQQKIAGGSIGSAALGAGRIAQLEAELKQAKKKEHLQKEEMESLSRAKREVEKHIEEVLGKISGFEDQVKNTEMSKSEQVKRVELHYEAEIEKLTRRIKWYAENQELLDRDSEQLKQKDEKIKALQDKVEHLTTEHGRRQAEAKARVKERAVDAKKIQDLQRQVREMESIIRKRNPNSLPVLMWAANAELDKETRDLTKNSPSVKFLEDRCKRLECELEAKDEEAKRSLRVMEQQYNNVKFQYEDRIKTLETTLTKYEKPGEDNHPHSHAVALQKELDAVRERYKKQVAENEGEIGRLRKEILLLKSKETASEKAECKTNKETEMELQSRIRTLESQLLDKEKERAAVQISLDRVQKEKQQLTSELARKTSLSKVSERGRRPRSAGRGTRIVSNSRKASSQDSLSGKTSVSDNTKTLPAYPSSERSESVERDYQPGSFMWVHIEDVVKENEELKVKVDRLQLEIQHSRINHQKLLAEMESRERRANEHIDDQVAALKLSHQVELQKILSDHAMSHSSTRQAELQGQVDTQEVLIRHLREQLGEARTDSEQLAAFKIRTTTLETQVHGLLDELQEAKKSHTPEMRHYTAIQEQIKSLESRHKQREQELKQIIHQSQAHAAADMEREVEKWKKILDSKNKEVEKFRTELDKILLVLKELQRQGVILPVSSGASSSRSSER